MSLTNEIIDAIVNINIDLYELLGEDYYISYHTNGFCHCVDFMGLNLYNSEMDILEEDGDNLEAFLRKQLNTEINKLSKVIV